jgi:N-acetylglucosaminyl-diphospho-decaprenol L-rhamnosyltransferase
MVAEPLDLSIVIVNWNVCRWLRECLVSLRDGSRLAPEHCEIIVVDNASEDGSVEMLRTEFGEVRLIASDDNLGFAEGCQRGYDISRGRFVLMLNPDTVVLDGAIDTMLGEMEAHPDAGIIGSRLVNTDGSFQRACGGALASLRNVAWNFLFLNRLLPPSLSPAPLFLENDPPGLFEIGWVSGAAMLLRREAIGPRVFDPAFFMFGEDMDLCARVARGGWKVLYSAHHTIVHHHGRSLDKQLSPEVLATLHKGPRTFFRKTHGPLAVLAYDLIFLVGYLTRWIAFGLLARIKGGEYSASANFSRQYVGILLRLLWARS